MSKIIDFTQKQTSTEKESDKMAISMPTEKEIMVINSIVDACPADEMVDSRCWNGDCWQSMFEQTIIPYAKEKGLNPWDVFAVFIMKMNGVEFSEGENGIMGVIFN